MTCVKSSLDTKKRTHVLLDMRLNCFATYKIVSSPKILSVFSDSSSNCSFNDLAISRLLIEGSCLPELMNSAPWGGVK